MSVIPIQTIKTDRFEMDYFTFGTGVQPFVLLPGASVKSAMPSAPAIADAYARFGEAYTVYVFDRKKHMEPDYDAAAIADDTAEAMQLLGIFRACIMGCSLGGMAAQWLAIRYPELVHKLVLASTLSRQNDMSRTILGDWYRLACDGDARALNHSVWQKVYSPAYYEQYKDVFAFLEPDATAEELQQFSVQMHACRTFDAYDQLDRITCPTFVIGSWDDRTLSGDSSVELARKLRCPLYMYSGYGHAVYDEAPDYKARLLDFFAEQ